MSALRNPDTGCPWDIEQTFETIVPYTIEEVHEVVDAIERNDMDDLREELGDLLLQVVYFAQMAHEQATFDFADVVESVTTKMIRRHPHVFGDEEARNAGMAKGAWERIKAQEKADRAARRLEQGLPPKSEARGLLDDVPAAMPATLEALKLQQKAAKVGFDWNDPNAVIAKLREELNEFEAAVEAGSKDDMKSEFGDTLFSLINIARHHNIDAEAALRGTNAKFRKRFGYVESTLEGNGGSLEEASLDRMEELWQEAKTETC